MPFKKRLLFKPTEPGHITQFFTFDTSRARMYTAKQMKNLRDNVIHASASDTVLKNLTRTILTQGNTVRFPDSEVLERLLSLDDRFLMDHFLTPSFFVDNFNETFGPLGYYIHCLGNFFACLLLERLLLMLLLLSSKDLKFEKFLVPLLLLSELC